MSGIMANDSRRRRNVDEDDDESPYCQFQIGDHYLEEDGMEPHFQQRTETPDLESQRIRNCSNAPLTNSKSGESHHEFSRPRTLGLPLRITVPSSPLPPEADICGSLPANASYPPKQPRQPRDNHAVPKIRCHYVSAPATPAASHEPFLPWAEYDTSSITSIDEEAQEAELLSPDDAISVSSVDLGRRSKSKYRRSLSRLSLNLMSREDISPSPSPTLESRSPSIIPRFLRNSFSKLMSRKPLDALSPSSAVESLVVGTMHKCASAANVPDITPEKGSDVLASLENNDGLGCLANDLSYSFPEVSGILPCSPSTLEYLEESRLRGLPVIPFAYPTHVVAEKLKERNRKQKTPSGDSGKSGKSEPKDIVTKRRLSVLDYDLACGGFEPKSLDNLVDIAERELAHESLFDRPSPDHHVHMSMAGRLLLLASSDDDSGTVGKWPSYEFEDWDHEEESGFCRRPASGHKFNSSKSFQVRRPDGKASQKADLRRSRTNSEDDGYIEMIPKSCNPTPSPPLPSNEISPVGRGKLVKCLLSRADSDEHFKMDFSNKG